MITIQAVLYICHGSRRPQASEEAVAFVKRTMKHVQAPIQEICFLELAEPTIEEGVNRCVERGATRIAIVPVLLLTAAHAKKDIPDILHRVAELHPNVAFNYGQPLGIQETIIDVLVERIKSMAERTDDVDLLLVGRGSSDEEAIQDFESIAKRLGQRLKMGSVQTCFLAAASPRFEDLLLKMVQDGAKKVMVLPYLLFTGVLVEGIHEFVDQLDLAKDQDVTVCDYLGSHDNLALALKDRVEEVMLEGDHHATMA